MAMKNCKAVANWTNAADLLGGLLFGAEDLRIFRKPVTSVSGSPDLKVNAKEYNIYPGVRVEMPIVPNAEFVFALKSSMQGRNSMIFAGEGILVTLAVEDDQLLKSIPKSAKHVSLKIT